MAQQFRVFLLLGGNIGQPTITFKQTLVKIDLKFKRINLSSVYRTAAWGMEKAPDFHNQVVELYADCSANELLAQVLDWEREAGRFREEEHRQGYQNRVLDIDILYFDQQLINRPKLQVPHPRLHKRRFALVPMAEIAPQWLDPARKKTVSQMLDECKDPGKVERL